MREPETIHLALSAAENRRAGEARWHSNRASMLSPHLDLIPRRRAATRCGSTLSGAPSWRSPSTCQARQRGEGGGGDGSAAAEHAISNLNPRNTTFQSHDTSTPSSNDGRRLQSWTACLFSLLKRAKSTVDEALKFANQPESLNRLAS